MSALDVAAPHRLGPLCANSGHSGGVRELVEQTPDSQGSGRVPGAVISARSAD